MLSLFRINDPLRLVLAAAVFLLLRFALFYPSLPATGSDMLCRMVGARMAEGKIMYADIWENMPPLSAGVFWLLHLLFGSSPLAFQLAGAGLVIVQASILNNIALHYNLYNEKNYLPALFYCLFALVSFDAATLSPPLLAALPLLLMLNQLLRLRDRVDNEGLFAIGMYVGIALLLYYPAVIFIAFVPICALLLRSLSPRQMLIIVLGTAFIPLCVTVYYHFRDGTEALLRNYWLTLFLPERFLQNWNLLSVLLAVPSISLIWAMVRVFGSGMFFINFQQTVHRIMFLWLSATAAAGLLFSRGFSGNALILAAAPYAFFITHHLLLPSKKWIAETTALLLGILLPGVGWLVLNRQNVLPEPLKYDYLLPAQALPLPEEAKKILVLDNRWQYYHGRQPATPYLRPELAAAHLKNLDRYAIAQAVYLNITAEMPDLIITKTPQNDDIRLFERLQILTQWYQPHPKHPDMYYRRARPEQ